MWGTVLLVVGNFKCIESRYFDEVLVLNIVRAFPETDSHNLRINIIVCRTALVSVAEVVASSPE